MKYRVMLSTIEGVGIEYGDFSDNSSEFSSKSLSTMLLRLPRKEETANVAFDMGGDSEVECSQSVIEGGLPLRIADESRVTLRDVTIDYKDNINKVFYAEFDANRMIEHWSEASAIRRAAGIILQAHTERSKAIRDHIPLHEYISNYKQRTILLLGNYNSEGRERLDRIKEAIGKTYNIIMVDEIPENPMQTLLQKVSLIGNLCRFVIVDDSTPSGHIHEVEIARNSNLITILLHKNGRRSTFMNADFAINSKNIKDFDYTLNDLADSLAKATQWAEQRLTELERELTSAYPWRRK